MSVRFRARRNEEPEINLVPFIDVLLVILIFLMLSTTFTRVAELQVDLPVSSAQTAAKRPAEVIVTVTGDGRYAVDGQPVAGRSVDALVDALAPAARKDPATTVVLSADAVAAHQSVINVMDAARRAGLSRLAFATRHPGGEGGADATAGSSAP